MILKSFLLESLSHWHCFVVVIHIKSLREFIHFSCHGINFSNYSFTLLMLNHLELGVRSFLFCLLAGLAFNWFSQWLVLITFTLWLFQSNVRVSGWISISSNGIWDSFNIMDMNLCHWNFRISCATCAGFIRIMLFLDKISLSSMRMWWCNNVSNSVSIFTVVWDFSIKWVHILSPLHDKIVWFMGIIESLFFIA